MANAYSNQQFDLGPVCPKRLQWVADRGMDFSTWDEIGGKEWYSRSGSYQLDAEDFEED